MAATSSACSVWVCRARSVQGFRPPTDTNPAVGRVLGMGSLVMVVPIGIRLAMLRTAERPGRLPDDLGWDLRRDDARLIERLVPWWGAFKREHG